MASADLLQPAFYIFVAPCPPGPSPHIMLGSAMPHMMSGWYPYSAPICAHEQNTSQVDTTDVASIFGKVWRMSQDQAQCHEVQRILEDSDETTKVKLAEELHGHVWDAIHHPYANFVVQKCVEALRPEAFQFIVDEIISSARVQSVAQHKFGCRIIQRLLEYCREDQLYELVRQLLSVALALTKSNYGIYVIPHILEYACKEHQRHLIDLLTQHASDICCSNISCAVAEGLLKNGHDEDRVALARAVLEQKVLTKMARSRHGHSAVKTILKLFEGSSEYGIAHGQLVASKDSLSKTRYGRSILKMIEEKSVSDTCSVLGSSKPLLHESNHRMSWADMSSDTEEEC